MGASLVRIYRRMPAEAGGVVTESAVRRWHDGPVAVYRDAAVVLRVTKLGEADRIVTLLARRTGRVRAVAKGVRRTKSRFGARLEPFSHVDLQLYAGRNLDIVTQAVTLDAFGPTIAADYARYTAATAIVETAERLTAEEREPSLRLYLLLVSALRALAGPVGEDAGDGNPAIASGVIAGGSAPAAGGSGPAAGGGDPGGLGTAGGRRRDPGLVLDAFLLRAMVLAGWAPALRDCARCATPGPHAAFHVPSGGALCANCRGAGYARPAPATLTLMSALTSGDWATAEEAGAEHRREASGLVAALLQYHLERGLRSLPMVDRAAPSDLPVTDLPVTDLSAMGLPATDLPAVDPAVTDVPALDLAYLPGDTASTTVPLSVSLGAERAPR